MPQMSPINWIMMFSLFSIIFIFFNIMNYYCFFYTKNSNKNKSFKNKNNFLFWKW